MVLELRIEKKSQYIIEGVRFMLIVKNVNIINGDGQSIQNNTHIVIINGIINEVSNRHMEYNILEKEGAIVIDGKGNYAIPGIINHHTHCISNSPFMATGGKPVSKNKRFSDLNTHLSHGTTTLCTVDCFTLAEEIKEVQEVTPINLKYTTGVFPRHLEAAKLFDGTYLSKKHLETTIYEQLCKGAVSIGEIGAGVTLGGAGQDYKYIPLALEKITGIWFDTPTCRELKYAVLGRFIETSAFDEERVRKCLEKMGVSDIINPAQAKDIVTKSVMKGFNVAIEAIYDATDIACKYGVPIIVHNAASSAETVLNAAKRAQNKTTFIAAHSNHSTFTIEESIEFTKKNRSLEAIIDIGTLDAFHTQKIIPDPETIFALISEGLVDLISTDYGGGNFDSILEVVAGAFNRKLQSLPQLIRMCTSAVADHIPLIAPNRGRIKVGKIADIAILDKEDLTKVTDVIINGKHVLKGGLAKKM